jgi:hypothetical protein
MCFAFSGEAQPSLSRPLTFAQIGGQSNDGYYSEACERLFALSLAEGVPPPSFEIHSGGG